MSGLLSIYFSEIAGRPLLNAEEEVELAKKIEAGLLAGEKLSTATDNEKLELQQIVVDGELAYKRMFEGNLRLVVSIAKRHVGQGLELADLIQEGNLGLMNAIAKFDFTRGIKFSTLASWWIRQALTVALRTKSRLVRLPSGVHATELRVRGTARELSLQLNREPTNLEIAKILGIAENEVAQIRQLGRMPVSLQGCLSAVPEHSIEEILVDEDELSPPDILVLKETREALSSALRDLTADERKVVELRYGLINSEALSISAIAKKLGIKRVTAEALESTALAKLRYGLVQVA
jgi:RNA polymerase primary sigma factor